MSDLKTHIGRMPEFFGQLADRKKSSNFTHTLM